MNIPQITAFRFNNQVQNRKQNAPLSSFGLKMSSPITMDTVSFTGTNPVQCIKNGVSRATARLAHEKAEPMQNKVVTFLNDLFGDLLVSKDKTNNPIIKIAQRVKSARSIREKSAANQYNNLAEILYFMTDLNGAKLVLRAGNKKSVDNILRRFLEPIRSGKIELTQIENKRPSTTMTMKGNNREKFDYASIDCLEELRFAQEDRWDNMRLKEPRYVDVNYNDVKPHSKYPGIHFLFRLPGEERPFELIVLGKNVNDLKDLDDLIYKILDNKDVDPIYKPIERIVNPLKEAENAPILNKFNKYRTDAFVFQREKKPTAFYDEKAPVSFLPPKDDVLAPYDLNYLYKLKLQCEAEEAERIARRNREAGKKAK